MNNNDSRLGALVLAFLLIALVVLAGGILLTQLHHAVTDYVTNYETILKTL